MDDRCIICGTKKDITKHSVVGDHKPPYVNLCAQHHIDIENIKTAIKVMNREKKISIRQFRRIIDSVNNLENVEVKNV